MSKKNKAKFKKQLKAEFLNNISKDQAETRPISDNHPKKAVIEIKDDMALNLTQIRTDLIKTGIVVAYFIVLIVILFLADSKTGILAKSGDYLFRLLDIGR